MKNLPIGTVINVATIIIGGLLGLFLKQFFTEGMETIIFQALGLGTILIGLKMALKLPDGYILVCIFSLVLGGIVGELIHLDGIIMSLSDNLKSFSGSSDSSFSEGLITAFLLFCIGSMTIVGAIEEGLNHNRELLIVKSTLDGFSSIALAATLGIGVLFSVVPLFIFQGGLTISAKKLKPVFDQTTIDAVEFCRRYFDPWNFSEFTWFRRYQFRKLITILGTLYYSFKDQNLERVERLYTIHPFHFIELLPFYNEIAPIGDLFIPLETLPIYPLCRQQYSDGFYFRRWHGDL